ncbi:hypothetical protein SDC9_194899 [bioreactor metagenome]|uniref:Uncharacterized protein n=1 Tax=bioreactor metagenome TaxID=1076179 RepID=A0A645I7I1_9ZZZZ
MPLRAIGRLRPGQAAPFVGKLGFRLLTGHNQKICGVLHPGNGQEHVAYAPVVARPGIGIGDEGLAPLGLELFKTVASDIIAQAKQTE